MYDITTMDSIFIGAASWLIFNHTKHGNILASKWLGFRCSVCLGFWVGVLITVVSRLETGYWDFWTWIPRTILGSWAVYMVSAWFTADTVRRTFSDSQLAEAMED